MDRIEPTIPDHVKERIMAHKNCFASEAGMLVLKDLKSYCVHDGTPVQKRGGQPIDAFEVMFLEGRRDVIDYILRQIEKDLPTG